MKKTGFFTSAILALTLGWGANIYAQSTSQRNSNQINEAQKIEKWVNNIDQIQYQNSVKKFLDNNKNNKNIGDEFYNNLAEVYDTQNEINNLKTAKVRQENIAKFLKENYENMDISPFLKKVEKILRWDENMFSPSVQDSVADYLNKFYYSGTTANFDFQKFNGNMKHNQFEKVGDEYWGPIAQVGKNRVRKDVKTKNKEKYGFEVPNNIEFKNQGMNHFVTTYANLRNFSVPTDIDLFKKIIAFNSGGDIKASEIDVMYGKQGMVLDFFYTGKDTKRLYALNKISNHALESGEESKTHINIRPGQIIKVPNKTLLEKSVGMYMNDAQRLSKSAKNGYKTAADIQLGLMDANAKKDNLVAQLDFENMMSGKYADNLRGMNKPFGKVAFGPEYGRNVTDGSYSLGAFITMPGPWNSRIRISGSYSPRGQFNIERINLVEPEDIHMEETKTLAGQEYTAVENRGIRNFHQEINKVDGWNAGLGLEILHDFFLGANYGQEVKSGTEKGIEWIENYRLRNGNKINYKFDEEFLPTKNVSEAKKLLGLYVAFQNILNSGFGASLESNYDVDKKFDLLKPDNAKLNVNYDLKKLVDYSVTLFK